VSFVDFTAAHSFNVWPMSLADEDLVKDDRLDDEGIDGSFSLHWGPSNCCSIEPHLRHTTQTLN